MTRGYYVYREKHILTMSHNDRTPPEITIPPASLTDFFSARKEFHLKEYESLKKELADLVEHSRKIEIYAVGGIAAFYSWFLLKVPNPPHIALYIPIIVAVLGSFRSWSVLTRIQEIASYLREVEDVFALRDLGLTGWETHRRTKSSSPFVSSAAVFWLVLVAVSVVARCIL